MENYSTLLGTFFFIIVKAVIFLSTNMSVQIPLQFPCGYLKVTTYLSCREPPETSSSMPAGLPPWGLTTTCAWPSSLLHWPANGYSSCCSWAAHGRLQVVPWACYGWPLWDRCQPDKSAHTLLVAHHAQRRSADGSNLSRRSPRRAWKLKYMHHHNRAPLNKCCSSIWLAHCLRLLLRTDISCLAGGF